MLLWGSKVKWLVTHILIYTMNIYESSKMQFLIELHLMNEIIRQHLLGEKAAVGHKRDFCQNAQCRS